MYQPDFQNNATSNCGTAHLASAHPFTSKKRGEPHAVAIILGIAKSLSVDAAWEPASRETHLAYLDGAASIACRLGRISAEREKLLQRDFRQIFLEARVTLRRELDEAANFDPDVDKES